MYDWLNHRGSKSTTANVMNEVLIQSEKLEFQ